MKLHLLSSHSTREHGSAHHLLLPIIAVIAVAGIGTYLIGVDHAATPTYSGPCTSTIMTSSTKITTSKYKVCLTDAQTLMNGIESQKYQSYRAAWGKVSGDTFADGTAYYLYMNGVMNTPTINAVKALPLPSGYKTPAGLTNGTSGGWQVLCQDAAGAGLSTGGKQANATLKLGSAAGQYATAVNATIFSASCGSAVKSTSGGGSTSTGGSANSAALPSGSSYGNNALAQWDTALKNRTTSTATWVAWGDSVTEGQGSTTVTGRWINQTLTALRSKYPVSGVTGGFGYVPSFYGTYNAGSTENSDWSTDPKLSGNASENTAMDSTLVSSQNQQLGNGAGLGLRTITLKSGGSETFSVTGSSIDIMYNYGSGSFTYTVDNKTTGTVSTSGGSGATGRTHVVFSTVGAHTVVIKGASGSVILEGVMVYNGDESKGIRLYDSAQCSMTTTDYLKQATNIAAITASVKADLVTIELGPNDFGREGATPTQTTANLKAMIADIRNASTGHEPSIALIVPYGSTDTNSLGYAWSAYASAIKAVTSADSSVGLIDLSSFGTNGTPNGDGGLIAVDGIHPSNAGQAKLASMVEEYLENE